MPNTLHGSIRGFPQESPEAHAAGCPASRGLDPLDGLYQRLFRHPVLLADGQGSLYYHLAHDGVAYLAAVAEALELSGSEGRRKVHLRRTEKGASKQRDHTHEEEGTRNETELCTWILSVRDALNVAKLSVRTGSFWRRETCQSIALSVVFTR